LTQTLLRTLIEQEGSQGVLSDGGGRKYQLKKNRGNGHFLPRATAKILRYSGSNLSIKRL
jgi:preprotein translocase subunit SecG